VVAGTVIEPAPRTDPPTADTHPGLSDTLRRHPSNRLVRQLARCAKEYRCRAAANAFIHAQECALPIAAPANEHPPEAIDLGDEAEARPAEPAAFHPSAAEVVEIAVAHLEGGGSVVAFDRVCEGEPLREPRLVDEAL